VLESVVGRVRGYLDTGEVASMAHLYAVAKSEGLAL
jgi:hypothetical protein